MKVPSEENGKLEEEKCELGRRADLMFEVNRLENGSVK